jgi:hypothetical protein
MNLRKEWFAYVAKIRRKQQRKTKKECTHREAMKIAATSWPAEKVKLINRSKREARKAAREAKATSPLPAESPEDSAQPLP